jgi:deoxycytidine triphosphate deaminase/cell division protein FtsL
MTEKQSFLEGTARAFARWMKIPLADEAPAAMCKTEDRGPASGQEAAEPDPGWELAKQNFEKWKDRDPFPKILPALLNSADIDDYMRATSMVFPYTQTKRKTASYALSVGTEIAYWDPEKTTDSPIHRLEVGDRVTIPSNSLIYVQTREIFQLPNYLAVRFNLHIDLVHKGLLLGTGPLVDPGFTGRLMVPLHNLTSNNYVLAVGDDFIWAEFTKTSTTDDWIIPEEQCLPREGSLVEFPERKTDKSLADYLDKAKLGHPSLQPGLSHSTLQNAIPDAIARTRKTAEGAKESAAKAKKQVNRLTAFVTGIGLLTFVGAAGVLWTQIQSSRSALLTTLGIVNNTNTAVQEQGHRISELENKISELQAAQPRSSQPNGGGVAKPK